MKTKSFILVVYLIIIFVVAISFSSCSKDEVVQPDKVFKYTRFVYEQVLFDIDNSAYVGSDINIIDYNTYKVDSIKSTTYYDYSGTYFMMYSSDENHTYQSTLKLVDDAVTKKFCKLKEFKLVK